MAFLREVFTREVLPPPLDAERPARPAPGLLGRLLAPEDLPGPSPAALQAGHAGGRGLFSLLLAPDPLPPDLPPAPRRPRRWSSWVFSAEKLDP